MYAFNFKIGGTELNLGNDRMSEPKLNDVVIFKISEKKNSCSDLVNDNEKESVMIGDGEEGLKNNNNTLNNLNKNIGGSDKSLVIEVFGKSSSHEDIKCKRCVSLF